MIPEPRPGSCKVCGTATALPYCPRDGELIEPAFELGRYRLQALLGAGGNAFVFAGVHQVMDKPVAVKVLRDDGPRNPLAERRFFREARTAGQLSHPNIVSTLDFGHDEATGVAYLVMERATGMNLAQLIAESGAVPVARALPILVQLARALAYAHGEGVVHRDVNPKNVMVGRGDTVQLCDFGISRRDSVDGRMTSTGALMGTPAYMAPEQIRGETVIASDIYAFGCTAFQLLTGKFPHMASTASELFAKRLSEFTVRQLSESGASSVPEELEDVIASCLETRAELRPSAVQVEAALLAISATSGTKKRSANVTGQIVGSYRIVKQIGKGGVSTVYLAEHPIIGTKVAIKVIAPEIAILPAMSERFIQEARASSDLANPHLPRYFDFGFLDTGQPYAVMEFLEGETLAARIARSRMSLDETVEVARQVARAMSIVHAAGLIHRDLKPDNLFLVAATEGRPFVKILDFGIAKAITPSAGLTSLGMMVGTPLYCAPEQAMGLSVDPSAEVYALGATIFEMLSGRPPFEGDASQVLGAKTTREAPLLSTVVAAPSNVDADLASMLAREAPARMATMTELERALSDWLAPPAFLTAPSVAGTRAPTAEPMRSPEPPPETRHATTISLRPTRNLARIGIPLGVAALVIAAVALLWPRDPVPAPRAATTSPAVTVEPIDPIDPRPTARVDAALANDSPAPPAPMPLSEPPAARNAAAKPGRHDAPASAARPPSPKTAPISTSPVAPGERARERPPSEPHPKTDAVIANPFDEH